MFPIKLVISFMKIVWESTSKQESAMKVDFSPSAPLPHYPDIFCDFVTLVKSCKNVVTDDIINFDHFQNHGMPLFHLNVERKNILF